MRSRCSTRSNMAQCQNVSYCYRHDTHQLNSLPAHPPKRSVQKVACCHWSLPQTCRYTCLLEVTMHPHIPSVSALAPRDLVEFCQERGYRCLLEPAGSLVVPPESSVETTDWERGKMLR